MLADMEAYLKLSQTSTMDLFLRKYLYLRLKSANYIRKKTPW